MGIGDQGLGIALLHVIIRRALGESRIQLYAGDIRD